MAHDECPSNSTGGTEADNDDLEGFLLRSGSGRTLSISDAIALLTNDRRRALLLLLRDQQQEMTINAVIQQLAEKENMTRDGGVDEDTRESIHLALTHHHIPKLDQADVVEWNADDETLRYHGDLVLDAYLDVTEELEGH